MCSCRCVKYICFSFNFILESLLKLFFKLMTNTLAVRFFSYIQYCKIETYGMRLNRCLLPSVTFQLNESGNFFTFCILPPRKKMSAEQKIVYSLNSIYSIYIAHSANRQFSKQFEMIHDWCTVQCTGNTADGKLFLFVILKLGINQKE